MNKKRLLGFTIATLLIVSSTATVAFASRNSISSTKNVVKTASVKNDNSTKEVSENDKKNQKGSKLVTKEELEDQLKKFQDGTLKASPEAIENTKDMIKRIENGEKIYALFSYNTQCNIPSGIEENNVQTNSNIKLLNISDDEAIGIAKDAIKKYTGLDIERVIKEDGLKASVIRNNNKAYDCGPDIVVFFNDDKQQDNIFAIISAVDGKVYTVTAMTPRNKQDKANINKNEVKSAALEFLRINGFGTNVKSIDFDNEKISIGISEVKCLYDDGTEILLEFSGSNNSIVNFTYYNLNTTKFSN